MMSTRHLRLGLIGLFLLVLSACSFAGRQPEITRTALPAMAWDHRPEAADWTRATLASIKGPGAVLLDIVPGDIAAFCPAYAGADRDDRAAFWSGLLSALAKHESTWRPEASGGGGRWIGLTQIYPPTARTFGCQAQTVAALKDGAANLSCAVNIMAAQVGRDQMLVSEGGAWRGTGHRFAMRPNVRIWRNGPPGKAIASGRRQTVSTLKWSTGSA